MVISIIQVYEWSYQKLYKKIIITILALKYKKKKIQSSELG